MSYGGGIINYFSGAASIVVPSSADAAGVRNHFTSAPSAVQQFATASSRSDSDQEPMDLTSPLESEASFNTAKESQGEMMDESATTSADPTAVHPKAATAGRE